MQQFWGSLEPCFKCFKLFSIQDLLKHTPTSHPDHPLLQDALRISQNFLSSINEESTPRRQLMTVKKGEVRRFKADALASPAVFSCSSYCSSSHSDPIRFKETATIAFTLKICGQSVSGVRIPALVISCRYPLPPQGSNSRFTHHIILSGPLK